MRAMKKLALLSLVFLSLQLDAFAKGVTLVSDIDDTIKVSHVLDIDSVLVNAFTRRGSFMGMAKLYEKLEADQAVNEFVYLSNAPKFIMYPFHRMFLNRNDFPDGTLMLNLGLSKKHHKINSLRRIIENDSPDELVLIGDNGERDTEVYAEIAAEYPDLKITTFIHAAYSLIGYRNNYGKPMEVNQIPYATSLDLAAELMKRGYLTADSYTALMMEFAPLALEEGDYEEHGHPIMFPAWLDCRDITTFDLPVVTEESRQLITDFQTKLSERCSVEPYRN